MQKLRSQIFELFKFILVVVLIVVPIRFFIAQPFIVQGSSMEPNFKNSDYLIVDQISFRFREPKNGEVVIFRYPNNPSQFYIKRIAGIPGENMGNITLKEDEYFVLGDNREHSSDSRHWGTLKRKFIVGRAWLRLWPVVQIDYLPGSNSD